MIYIEIFKRTHHATYTCPYGTKSTRPQKVSTNNNGFLNLHTSRYNSPCLHMTKSTHHPQTPHNHSLPVRQYLPILTLLQQRPEKVINGVPHAHWWQFAVCVRHCADTPKLDEPRHQYQAPRQLGKNRDRTDVFEHESQRSTSAIPIAKHEQRILR